MEINANDMNKEALRYIQKKKEEEKLFDKYPTINNGKFISDNFGVNLLPKFKEDHKLKYNLSIKYKNLINGLSITNENIIESFILYKKIKENDIETIVFNSYSYSKWFKLNEYIVSDIRKFIDESIATLWCLKYDNIKRGIKIDSIGSLLKNFNGNEENWELPELKQFVNFFSCINDISNSYKHSFTNNMELIMGSQKNCVMAIYDKYNKDISNKDNIKVYNVSLEDIINKFNDFYKSFFDIVNNLNTTE